MHWVLNVQSDGLRENEKGGCTNEKPDTLEAVVSLDVIGSCSWLRLVGVMNRWVETHTAYYASGEGEDRQNRDVKGLSLLDEFRASLWIIRQPQGPDRVADIARGRLLIPAST